MCTVYVNRIMSTFLVRLDPTSLLLFEVIQRSEDGEKKPEAPELCAAERMTRVDLTRSIIGLTVHSLSLFGYYFHPYSYPAKIKGTKALSCEVSAIGVMIPTDFHRMIQNLN